MSLYGDLKFWPREWGDYDDEYGQPCDLDSHSIFPSVQKFGKVRDEAEKLIEDDPIFLTKVYIQGIGCGTVIGYYHGSYAVDFDHKIPGGITCSGICRPGRGKWIPEKDIDFGIEIVREGK